MQTDSQITFEGCGMCRRSTQNAWGGKRRLFKNDPRLTLLNGWPSCFFLGSSEDLLEQMFAQLLLSEVESGTLPHFYSAWGMRLTHHPQVLVKGSRLISNGSWTLFDVGQHDRISADNLVDKIWDSNKAKRKILVDKKNDKCAAIIWIATFQFPIFVSSNLSSQRKFTMFFVFRCLQCLDLKVCERSIITNPSNYRLYNTVVQP